MLGISFCNYHCIFVIITSVPGKLLLLMPQQGWRQGTEKRDVEMGLGGEGKGSSEWELKKWEMEFTLFKKFASWLMLIS